MRQLFGTAIMWAIGEPGELITRRRRQILVHSCIYYHMDTNVITDHQFDYLCVSLVEKTAEFPKVAEKCEYHDAFHGFDGSTGADLPYLAEEIVRAAERLVMMKRTGRI